MSETRERYTKIKWNASGVTLSWLTGSAARSVKSTLESSDAPAPAFVDALAAFRPLVLALLELGEDNGDAFVVQSVSLNEETDGRLGIVCTCLKTLAGCNAPLVLNTPHLREPIEPEEYGRAGFLPEGWLEAIQQLTAAADAYRERDRLQADLFAGAGAEA